MQSPAASESDYYLRLGLASDPFAADAMPEFFFVGAQRRFFVQRAVHALYFSGSTVLLLGVAGAGKTRTLTEIAKDLNDLADICCIEASVLMNAAEIRAMLAATLGLPASAAAGNTEFVYALERVRPADGDPQPVLIAIDAAQLLSIETLAECAALVAGAGGRLRLLLAGEADLNIAWQQAQAGAAEILELKPLDRNESEDYAYTKIQAAGYRGERLLSDAEFDRLYEQSGGNFALINALMPQFLQPQSESVSMTQRVRQLPLAHIVAATIVLAAVIFLALYRGNNAELSQPAQRAQPADIAQPMTAKKENGMDTVALQLPASTTPSTTPEIISRTPGNVSPALNTTNASSNAESEIAAKTAPVKTEVPQASPNKSSSLSDDERALLAMPSSQYVLQLIGAESKTTVDKFAKGAGKGVKLYVYHTQLRGKPWIIVVTGPYTDKNAAQAGLMKLPEAVRKQQPWPRTLANVQADIRAHSAR